MSFIGKFLTLIFTMFSIGCLFLAISVHTNRQPWMGKQKSVAVNPITQIDEKLKEADSQHQTAAYRAYRGMVGVFAGEYQRPIRRDFYTDQLAIVREGKSLSDPNPAVKVAELVIDPASGLVNIAPPARIPVRDLDSKPIQNITFYTKQIPLLEKEIAEQEDIKKKAIIGMEVVSTEIIGKDPVKGLRPLIREQKALATDILEEQRLLVDELTNRRVDRLVFVRRLRAMREREEELRKFLGESKTAKSE